MFARIYDNRRQQQPVDVTSTVSRASGEIVLTLEETIGHQSNTAGDLLAYTTHIPLKKLEPGPYVLTVEAGSASAPERPTVRRVLIRITE